MSESIEDCEYRPGAGAAEFTTVTEDDIAAISLNGPAKKIGEEESSRERPRRDRRGGGRKRRTQQG